MDWDKWAAKQYLGQSLEEALHLPSQETTLRLLQGALISPIPERILGQSTDGGLTTYSDTDRKDHFHIVGAPDQGKSKLLEMMMSEDIIQLQDPKIPFRSSFCFLDAGTNANTLKKVLRFCVQRKFEKVLLVDPRRMWAAGKVVPINPIDYSDPPDAVAGHLMDTVRYLWATEDPMKEAIIRRYLPKVFRAIRNGKFTLPDAECFTIPVLSQVHQMLDVPGLDFSSKQALTQVMTKTREAGEFQSTVRRLDPFFSDVLKLIFGSRQGINFINLIKDGWVILVNLFPGGVYLEEHAKLLGLIVLNEISKALERLTEHHYSIPYYVYIDEVGLFASRKLTKIVDYYRHLNMRLTIAHQGFGQIEEPYVLNAIRRSSKNKVLFYTALHSDRYTMCQDMNYGGELPLQQVTYALGSTAKQEAVVKIAKQPPVLTRIKQWPDPTVTDKEVEAFIQRLYQNNPQLYRDASAVRGEITTRFATTQTSESLRGNRREERTARRASKVSRARKGNDSKGSWRNWYRSTGQDRFRRREYRRIRTGTGI